MGSIEKNHTEDRQIAWVFLLNRYHKTNQSAMKRLLPSTLQWLSVAVEGGRNPRRRKIDLTPVMRLASLS